MPPTLARSLVAGEALLRTPSSALLCQTRPHVPVPSAILLLHLRHASSKGSKPGTKKEAAQQTAKAKKRKKDRVQFKRDPLAWGTFYPLCDAMRYIRAFETGYSGVTTKYDLAINLKTNRSSPVVRNSIRLPHPVDTSKRIAVICSPDSDAAKEAAEAGATLIGEETIFEAVKAGNIDFERCLCHTSSHEKLLKSGLARLLGPKGLMPNPKAGTVLKEVGLGVESLRGGLQFRERTGVIRLPIGRLNHTAEQLQANISALMAIVKKDVAKLNEKIPKGIHDVVLSSPRSPGFPLNGTLMGEESLEPEELLEPA